MSKANTPKIGQYNTLTILRHLDIGLSLDGGALGSILLPRKDVPEDAEAGDAIKVFLYLDSEDRLIATTQQPKAKAGDFALLKVAAVNKVGAFLDWGLPKDLLVPYNEQPERMEVGKSYLVKVYVDRKTGRLAASTRLERFLDLTPATFEQDEEVELIVYGQMDLGFKAIINGTHSGILYRNEVFRKLRFGQRIKGYIKKVREDGKIDLALQPSGYAGIDDISRKILTVMTDSGGFLPLSDRSKPELIYKTFGISKKVFKKAIGALYKARLIVLEKAGIRLTAKGQKDKS